jgi:putative sigma-54 modulation protein
MQTTVSFKNLDPSDNLKAYVSDKLDRFDKYLDAPADASVVLSVEKFRHITEINIVGDRLKIKGKEETNDMYSAIDMVLDKLEKQIKKNKQKKRDRRSGGSKTMVMESMAEAVAIAPAPSTDDGPKEVKVKSIDYKPMDVEEAILQMDLSDDSFLVFTNARTDQINVLYHRNDGHYGLIQPLG